jgi:2-keto-4-pentenoate hydratase/2-oxohepta-3-ene-1,7-dioic acid hydratase in catechol pathway
MVIIGKGGRHISEADALGHVFGYTVFNDGSVRDYQRKTHQWTPGKNFDNTGAIGPYVVTADDLPAGAAGLKIESRVGSEILQSSSTANMIWSVAQVIALIFRVYHAGTGRYDRDGYSAGCWAREKAQSTLARTR